MKLGLSACDCGNRAIGQMRRNERGRIRYVKDLNYTYIKAEERTEKGVKKTREQRQTAGKNRQRREGPNLTDKDKTGQGE